jgi:glucokinase
MYIGIDIGGSTIKGMISDRSGKELGFQQIVTPKTAKDIDLGVYGLIETLAASASKSKASIRAICIGSPGPIDRKRGAIIQAPNIPGFNNHPIVKNIEKRTGVGVLLENDATVALVGAWWKVVGSRYRNWIMLTLGTGIGGGLVIDDKMYTGISGNAMEVGHMSIELNGKVCGCGGRGCWERYASGTALVELARIKLSKGNHSSIHGRIKNEEFTPLLLYEEALKKDMLALEIFEEYAAYLGIGIANLINIFNPEAILIGGGISRSHRFILPIIKKIANQRALKGFRENVRYIPLKEPDKIPSYGAIKIAIDS